jgi:AcrR family transcriptional regulator
MFGPDMTARPSAAEPARPPRSVSPGRPPAADVPALLRHILRTAESEFLTRGYAEASVARIARAAGVSNKTIYARYPNKDALLIAVATDLAARSHESVLAAMTGSGGEPASVLRGFGVQVARSWAAPEEIGLYRLIVAEAVRFPQLAAVYRASMDRFGTTLGRYLREQTDTGTLAVDDPEAAARQFGMLAYGEIREKALLGESITDVDITRQIDRAVRVFLTGYANPTA